MYYVIILSYMSFLKTQINYGLISTFELTGSLFLPPFSQTDVYWMGKVPVYDLVLMPCVFATLPNTPVCSQSKKLNPQTKHLHDKIFSWTPPKQKSLQLAVRLTVQLAATVSSQSWERRISRRLNPLPNLNTISLVLI